MFKVNQLSQFSRSSIKTIKVVAELEAVAAAEVTPDTNSSAPAEVSNPAFI